MLTRPRHFGFHSSLAALLSCAVSLAGCGGADFASELTTKPKPRPLKQADGATLRLPQDERFAIATFDAHKAAELGGAAEANAVVSPDGSASATASVTKGGQASGTFQLGHAVENDTDRQIDLDVTVRFRYEFEEEATPPKAVPEAQVGLKLYARDDRNRLVRSFDLLRHSSDQGAAQRQGDERFQFTVTLGPGDSMSVFLAGQATIDAAYGRSASSALRLSDVRMEVTTRAAPPVRTAGDEQG